MKKILRSILMTRTWERIQEDTELLQVYRSLLNDLATHGIDVKSLQSVISEEKSHKTVQGMLKNEVETLATEYRNLTRLNLNLKLAEEPSFTRGPLFNDKEVEIAKQVQEKQEEIYQEIKDEEYQIEQEMEPVKEEARKKKSYWNGLGDSYFDRIW